jgi:hypothetical protein
VVQLYDISYKGRKFSFTFGIKRYSKQFNQTIHRLHQQAQQKTAVDWSKLKENSLILVVKDQVEIGFR